MSAHRKSRKLRLEEATAAAARLHAGRLEWLHECVTAPVRARCGLPDTLGVSEAWSWIVAERGRQKAEGDRVPLYAVTQGQLHRVDAYTGEGVATAQQLARVNLMRASLTELRDLADTQFKMQPLARVAIAAMAVERLTLCEPEEATLVVLAGVDVRFRALRMGTLHLGYPPQPATFAVADAWMTAEQIGALIAEYRDREGSLGGEIAKRKRVKRVQKPLDYLIEFVDERRPVLGRSTENMTWAEIEKEWLKLAPAEMRECVAIDLKKAYWRAVHLREDKGLRPKPHREGGEKNE
jgi:hypothetical protein